MTLNYRISFDKKLQNYKIIKNFIFFSKKKKKKIKKHVYDPNYFNNRNKL